MATKALGPAGSRGAAWSFCFDWEVEEECEAHAYLRKGGKEELFFENVDRVQPHEQGLLLENIFGQRKIVKARIKELALVDHRIILEEEEG